MRLSRIDDSNRDDHQRLRESDECFFLHEYTSGQGFGFGVANDLISNLKKPVDRQGRAEYAHKLRAIKHCSRLFEDSINEEWLKIGTLIPVPPSKARADPLYDDRILQICRGINPALQVDVREIVIQKATIRAAHESGNNRPTVSELEANYVVDEVQATQRRVSSIAIIDDVLTAGTHYRAMHNVISRRFPNIAIVGMFIARRVFPTATSDDDESPF